MERTKDRIQKLLKDLIAEGYTPEQLMEEILSLLESLKETSNSDEKVSVPQKTLDDDALKLKASKKLLELGIPAHIKGFNYIRSALLLCRKDPELLHYVTKVLYPTIASEFHTTPSRVERAIRHAIEVTWSRASDDLIQLFGYSVDPSWGKPTNTQFISTLLTMGII